MDVGRVDFGDGQRRYFINIADCGIGGEVVARVNRSRFKGGGLKGTGIFLWASLSTLMSFGSRSVSLDLDGQLLERELIAKARGGSR